MTKLTSLILANNRLHELPREIASLANLEYLDLGKNLFTRLPPSITQLTALKYLDLSSNSLHALEPTVARLTQLRTLNLTGNQLVILPRELGNMISLESASSEATTRDASETATSGGLYLNQNPLEPRLRTLSAEPQPLATRAVLAYLRDDTAGLLEASVNDTLPGLPEQGVGPHFELDAYGIADFAPPGALDAQGNHIKRLRELHPILKALSGELVESLSVGNTPHDRLLRRCIGYSNLVDQKLEDINFSLLFIEGVRLDNAAKADKKDSELPSLDPHPRELLDSLLSLHGPFIMATKEGREAIEEEERYKRRPDEERDYRAAAVAFAKILLSEPGIIQPYAAALVLAAAEQTGMGGNPERSGVVGLGTVKNVAITLTGGALVVAAPVMGGLTLGDSGMIAGGLMALVLGKSLDKSKALTSVLGRITAQIDRFSGSEKEESLENLRRGLVRQLAFVLRVKPQLRLLAKRSEHLIWLDHALDWIEANGTGGRAPD
jgi:hypothetical protein